MVSAGRFHSDSSFCLALEPPNVDFMVHTLVTSVYAEKKPVSGQVRLTGILDAPRSGFFYSWLWRLVGFSFEDHQEWFLLGQLVTMDFTVKWGWGQAGRFIATDALQKEQTPHFSTKITKSWTSVVVFSVVYSQAEKEVHMRKGVAPASIGIPMKPNTTKLHHADRCPSLALLPFQQLCPASRGMYHPQIASAPRFNAHKTLFECGQGHGQIV